MTSTVPAAALDAAFSNTFVGHIHIDSVKRRGKSNYYDLECQHATVEGDQIDVVALLYTENAPPEAEEVCQVSGTWIPTASPFLFDDSFCRILKSDGDLPNSFEPASPTVCLMCVVTEFIPASGTAVVRMVDFDRRVSTSPCPSYLNLNSDLTPPSAASSSTPSSSASSSPSLQNQKRTSANGNVLRPGRRWDKSPALRVGTFVFVRGTIYSQNSVTRLFNVLAEFITFLPITVTSDGAASPSPKKRKFVRKTSTASAAEAEPSTPVASSSALEPQDVGVSSTFPILEQPGTPTPTPNARGQRNGRSKAP